MSDHEPSCLGYTAYVVLHQAVVPLTILKVAISVLQALLLSICAGSFFMPLLTRFCLNEQSKLCKALRRATNDEERAPLERHLHRLHVLMLSASVVVLIVNSALHWPVLFLTFMADSHPYVLLLLLCFCGVFVIYIIFLLLFRLFLCCSELCQLPFVDDLRSTLA